MRWSWSRSSGRTVCWSIASLDAAIRVLALHPNQVAASRDRFRASGGKSDRFDRFVLCELVRTEAHRFRTLEPDSDETKALRALTRGREDLVAARVAMGNPLRAELERFWPGPVRMFSAIDTPVCLAFLEKYPSPQDARGLGAKRLETFLRAHGSTKANAADQLLAKLREAPAGRAGDAETRRRRTLVLALVRSLSVMVSEINRLESEIADALASHRDGPVFRSFFAAKTSVLCPAMLLAEIGDSRARYPHRDAIAAQAGSAPVAVESGKRKNAKFRWACNHRLRNALQTLAQSIRRWNPWAADLYAAVRPQPPPRSADPRPFPQPHHLEMLADPHPLRLRATHRAAEPHHRHHFQPVRPPARPTRHPENGQLAHFTANTDNGLTQDVFATTVSLQGGQTQAD
jgi:transposase